MSEITEEEHFNNELQSSTFLILHDDGVYKHLQLSTFIGYTTYAIDLLSWPGHVTLQFTNVDDVTDKDTYTYSMGERATLSEFATASYIPAIRNEEESIWLANFIRAIAQKYNETKLKAEHSRNK